MTKPWRPGKPWYLRRRQQPPKGWRVIESYKKTRSPVSYSTNVIDPGHLPGTPRWRRRMRPSRGMRRAIPWMVVAVILLAGAWKTIELPSTGTAADAASAAAMASDLIGRASVVDGDTIEIQGERIRILDIDAPESRQTCTRTDGEQWRCGQQAAFALSDWIGQRTVICDSTGKDRYDRWLARCSVGGKDIAEWLAREGWAVPYRDCKCEVVRAAANVAKTQRAGVWSGEFMMPWDWRAK